MESKSEKNEEENWAFREINSQVHRRPHPGSLGNFCIAIDFKLFFDAENDGADRFLKKIPESA